MAAYRKVRLIKRATGKFNLSYKIGEVFQIEEKQATELIGAGYAEAVKKTRKPKK